MIKSMFDQRIDDLLKYIEQKYSYAQESQFDTEIEFFSRLFNREIGLQNKDQETFIDTIYYTVMNELTAMAENEETARCSNYTTNKSMNTLINYNLIKIN